MKKIFFMIFIGLFCLGAITAWAGTAHKMIDKDYGTLYGDKAIIQLVKIVQESLIKDSSGKTPFPKTESFYGSAPIYLYTAFKKSGHYKGELVDFPNYLRTLVPAYDFDRSRVYSLSRFIVKGDGKKIVDFGFKRPINRNGGKEIAFADPKTGALVITANCMNVILDGEKVLETESKEPVMSSQKGWLCGCDRKEIPLEGPLVLRSNYENETIVLTQQRQKKILLLWLEDVDGKKVYIPLSEIIFTDVNKEGKSEVNYLVPLFDPNNCSIYHIKWWDRVGGSLRGKLHKAEDVLLDSGIIKVSVKEYPDINSLLIPWKVHYSKLFDKKEVVKVKSLMTSFQNNILTGDLGSRIFVHDRLIEITSFEGLKSWRAVARGGVFTVKDIPSGEYLVQIFHFPKDSNKGTLKPQVEFEEIISF
ncbi:hypothetical protein KKH36_00010 [Patescibacteria group bacterium]|nr:hypothetical protein [Patescibacteria group bacterium]